MTAYASDDRITTVGHAGVAELADALDLGSSAFRRAGSIPVTRTNLINQAHVEWSRELFDYVLYL